MFKTIWELTSDKCMVFVIVPNNLAVRSGVDIDDMTYLVMTLSTCGESTFAVFGV